MTYQDVKVVQCRVDPYVQLIGVGETPCSSGALVDYNTSSCIFRCPQDYMLVGSDSITCLPDGTFNNDLPSCLAPCPIVNALGPNMVDLSDGFNCSQGEIIHENDVCSFGCETGYTLRGSSSLTCLDDGTLFGDWPTCEVITCSLWDLCPPAHYLNEACQGSFVDYQTTCQLGCERGFILEGTENFTCQAYGTLDLYPDYRCLPVHCDVPEYNDQLLIGNCTIGQSLRFDTVCEFSCAEGFRLADNSPSTSICQQSSLFSEPFPQCVNVTCPVPVYSALLTGNCESNSEVLYNTLCEYGCNGIQYRLEGDAMVTCQLNGTLSGTLPVCRNITCLLNYDEEMITGSCSSNSEVLYDDTCSLECREGYNVVNGSSSVRCGLDGTFPEPPLTCTIVTCHVPAYDSVAGLNGTCPALGSVEWRNDCTFACVDGYQIDGAPLMTCQASGNFSEEVPNCIPLCRVSYVGQVSDLMGNCPEGSDVKEGTQCQFSCSTGHTLISEPAAICNSNGLLSSPPVCQIVTCHVPAYDSVAGLNGSCPALGSVEWRNNCLFACVDGYQIEGAPLMTCQASGNFSEEVPNCIRLCRVSYVGPVSDLLGNCPEGSDVTDGTQCQFDCGAAGYEFRTDHVPVCNSLGEFSSPVCQIITCPVQYDSQLIQGSCAVGSAVNYSTVCDFQCMDEELKIIGDSELTCLATRVLNGSIPTCVVNCTTDPCRNGGTCANDACLCPNRYTGIKCHLFDCRVNPCENGGTCTETGCVCVAGFSGTFCESDINECIIEDDPCHTNQDSHMICINNVGSYACECEEGYTLSADRTSCDLTPTAMCPIGYCLNGGTCIQAPTFYTCSCTEGYTGMRCEIALTCGGAICSDTEYCSNGQCTCRPGNGVVSGTCQDQCQPACTDLQTEMCSLPGAACQCRPSHSRGWRDNKCRKVKNRFSLEFNLLEIGGIVVGFDDAALAVPTSTRFKEKAQKIEETVCKIVEARGVVGAIGCPVVSFYSGSLGVNMQINTEETFTGDASTIQSTLQGHSVETNGHLLADTNDLLLSPAPINATDISNTVTECLSPTTNDCSENGFCIEESGVGYTCHCFNGFRDLYPEALPGRYCVEEDEVQTTVDTSAPVTPGTSNIDVPLLAGLLSAAGALLLILLFTFCCCFYYRLRRQEYIKRSMMMDDAYSGRYTHNVNNGYHGDQVSYGLTATNPNVTYRADNGSNPPNGRHHQPTNGMKNPEMSIVRNERSNGSDYF